MQKLPNITIDNKEVEVWLKNRTASLGVTIASTVREALSELMRKEKKKNDPA